MKPRQLWIDDVRPAPEGWAWAKSSDKAIGILCDNHDIDEISFDHDLGGSDTSMNVINYIEIWAEKKLMGQFKWHIHSANPVGRKNIETALDRIFERHGWK